MELTKYEPRLIEKKWMTYWRQKNYFAPSFEKNTSSYSIQLPPPNVTGILHMGHAFNQTIMDGLIRYHRMKGCNTCWIPGTDHAGIATQIVVERQLFTEGESRHGLGRSQFIKRIWDWKEISGSTMMDQMDSLGCSTDRSREYFTMDEERAQVVTDIFVRLYEQGLIYRGKRLVNWDPILGTAISDLEVENIEEKGHIWYIRYQIISEEEQSLIVATTRPETLLGDVAVAVHPDDERYQHLIGKRVSLPLTGRSIPVIADEYVDKDFGTGCVKITPAHDFNDYQLGLRHHKELINIFDLKAQILKEAEVYQFDGQKKESILLPTEYSGLDRFDARRKIVEDLDKLHLLVEVKEHNIVSPRGDRTGSVIEPLLTDQWFVSMTKVGEGDKTGKSLLDKAKDAVDGGEVKFIPANWVNTYNQWMNNIQDWCISRQLWWGHQIPAWYDEEGQIYVAKTEEEAKKLAGNKKLTQDPDVLDTWFSSALIPFSSLGWPKDTVELRSFLPSNVLVTGYEIIFFWVARMMMMTLHFTGKIPFKEIYIHGMVRDHEGKKMSKSEGNVIDPVDLINGVDLETLVEKRTTGLRKPEKIPQIQKETMRIFPEGIPAYGADALRFTMASYASLGRSINFDFKRCEGYRNFCNKIWNATRFVLMNVEGKEVTIELNRSILTFVDQWIISRLEQVIGSVTHALNEYRFDLASQFLYEFIWNEYCDWYVELAKQQLNSENISIQSSTRFVLIYVLEKSLRLLHPIMPFITEELWQTVSQYIVSRTTDSIVIAPWPESNSDYLFENAFVKMALLQDTVNAIRNLKGEMGINVATKPPLWIESSESDREWVQYLPMIARVGEIKEVSSLPEDQNLPYAVSHGRRMLLKVEIDKKAQYERLEKEKAKIQKLIDKIQTKLERSGYIEKAPPHLVEKDKKDLSVLQYEYDAILTQLNQLGN